MQHDKNKIEEYKQMHNLVDTVGNDVVGDTGAAMQTYADYRTALLQSSLERLTDNEQRRRRNRDPYAHDAT